MKNIHKSLFTILVIIFIASCTSTSDKNKELNELMIKETTSDTNQKQKSKSNTAEYFIKPLTDSTYTGVAEEKYPNGIVKYKGFYRFGKKHGEWLYFYPNGNLWSEAEFNRDKMNGKSNVYYPNGKLNYSGFYKNDLKDSVWTFYDSTGKETRKEIFKNGRLIKRHFPKQ